MGGACCKEAAEFNPDGSPKEPQTEEQTKNDPAELRKWAKDGDHTELERLLKRMRKKDIVSGAKKSESPEEEGHTALHFAAAQGSLPCVELLVLYSSAVNGRGAGGATPLHAALETGRRQVAHFLLEHGADINVKDAKGISPFLSVVLSGRKRLAMWLLSRVGDALDVGVVDKSGVGPCTAAARNGWWDMLEKLAAQAAVPETALNTRSAEGDTPLGWVLKYGAAGLLSGDALFGLVEKLLQRGASPVVPCFKEQIPPLCLVAASGCLPLLPALRNRGAELDPALCSDAVKRNALHYAAAKGHEAMAVKLMEEGASCGLAPHTPDAAGNTPLHLAALRGHDDVARALLERAPDAVAAIKAPNGEGVSVYHLILQAGPSERAQRGVLWILEKLSAEDAKAAIVNPKDGAVLETPLLLAVGSHQDQVVAKLLADGHDPAQANKNGDAPLSRCLACASADTAAADGAIFKMLVEKGVTIESAAGDCHPLLAICKNPLSKFAEQVVELLQTRLAGEGGALDWGAHADAAGRGPLHLAALHDNAFMVRYLLETVKLDISAPSGEGLTPLMYAAWGCSSQAMKILLNRRADPRAADPSGASTLSYCLRLDKPESLACAAMLLLMGASPDDSVDLRGEGLLHRAVRYGCTEFIRMWVRYGGNVCILATTEDAADEVPEALPRGAATGRKAAGEDYLDAAPQPLEVEEEAEDGAWDLGSTSLEAAKAGSFQAAEAPPPEAEAEEEKPHAEEPPAAAAVVLAKEEPPLEGAVSFEAGGGYGGGAGDSIKAYHPEQSGVSGSGGGGGDGGSFGRGASGGGGDGGSFGRRDSGGAVRAAGFEDANPAPPANAGGVHNRAPGEIESYDSFSVPADGNGNGNGTSRAVAEAVEALEAEISRFPSFCRRPSAVEVRRWARRGAAWFDDALPAAPELPEPELCPPALPLPPGEDEEAIEEARLEAEADPDIHPAMDVDALVRRMLLARIKDRRGAAAKRGPQASAASATSSGGSFTERLSSRLSSFGSGGPAAAAAAAAAPPVASAAAEGPEEWMEEVVRSAESVLESLQRGVPVDDSGRPVGAGPRAVRAMRAARRSAEAADAGAAGEASRPGKRRGALVRPAGPVAEGNSSSESSSEDSDNAEYIEATGDGKMESAMEDLKDAGIAAVSSLLDKKITVNDPYYKKGTRYKGVPRYMDEEQVPIEPASMSSLLELADELHSRLGRYPASLKADEQLLRGADLRERNIKWYNHGLSPSEYPLKSGQWKAALKKAKAAAQAARARAPRAPGAKPVVRSRKAWFGLPAMPFRPELKATSALVYAVRLARPACVAALLSASLQPLNVPDGWGHTPVAYAAYMLARDKHNAALQMQYDLLLEKLPQVNFTHLDQNDGNAGHTILCPINLAVISGDRSRLAHLVLRCAGAINNAWTCLPDIPVYLSGAWEKAVAKCDSRCPALALAVLSKRIDTVRLCLDLGANPNVYGEGRDLRAKAKLLAEWKEEQERVRRLADDYEGVLTKARLGLVQRMSRLKRAIASIEIPGISKPHPFVTPLHLAGRTGQAEVTFLLLRRGALSNGAGAVPYAKRTPLGEALLYARGNFTSSNAGAKRKNWKEVRPTLEDIPPMSDAAAKKDADQKASAMMRAMVDPTVMALKAVALAAKYTINFLLEMRKRPISHWDPAIAAAHVLLAFRAPYDLGDAQTSIVLRDIMDNGKWKWLRRPAAKKFKVKNEVWTECARDGIRQLKEDPDIGYGAIGGTGDPKEYRSLKQQFVARADESYFGEGSRALHLRWTTCSNRLLEAQREYLYDKLQPALLGMAVQAVTTHVQGAGALLEKMGAARREWLEEAADRLSGGVAVEEGDAMEVAKPLKAFALPAVAAAEAPHEAQTSSAAALRERAGRAASDESWGRVMVWSATGTFLGMPSEADLAALPSGDDELNKLGKELADVDTDELQESMQNLADNLSVAAEWLLARMQDTQQGLCQLFEMIGIDFLDLL